MTKRGERPDYQLIFLLFLSSLNYTFLIFSPVNPIALIATIIVDIAMTTAPTAGSRMIPINDNTPAASGIATKIHKFPPSEIPDSGFLCSNPKSKQNTTVLTRLITWQAVTLNFLGRCFGLFS